MNDSNTDSPSLLAIQAEIKEAIAKHLPHQVGNLLQQRLSRLQQLEKDYEDTKDIITKKDKRIEALEKRVSDQAQLDKLKKDLDEKEAKLREDQRELDHKLEIAKMKTDNAIQTKQEIKSIVELVFCSPVSKKSVRENFNENSSHFDAQGRNITKNKHGSVDVEENTTGPNLQA